MATTEEKAKELALKPSSIPPADPQDRAFSIQYLQMASPSRAFENAYPERVAELKKQFDDLSQSWKSKIKFEAMRLFLPWMSSRMPSS